MKHPGLETLTRTVAVGSLESVGEISLERGRNVVLVGLLALAALVTHRCSDTNPRSTP